MTASALDIETAFHHVPLPAFKGMEETMRGVVIAVSQYAASEREYITIVAKALGGK